MKSKRKKIERFANNLRSNLPRSEQWFWSEWRDAGMIDPCDESNSVFNGIIPDVINRKYKYVIEIDGSIHKKKKVLKKDNRNNSIYIKNNYHLFRIEAFNYDHFGILIDQILKIRKPFKQKVIKRSKG